MHLSRPQAAPLTAAAAHLLVCAISRLADANLLPEGTREWAIMAVSVEREGAALRPRVAFDLPNVDTVGEIRFQHRSDQSWNLRSQCCDVAAGDLTAGRQALYPG